MNDGTLDATTYYRATANRQFAGARPDELPARVDVAVIGAGLTGLSAALELASAGRRVAGFRCQGRIECPMSNTEDR